MMHTQIVAECAQGFEGNPVQARLLIKAAATAGADAVKFQLVYADELATPGYKYYDLFRSLEMSDEDWSAIAAYAKEQGIELYLDIFGTRSLQLSAQLGLGGIKLHGTDIANIGLLKEVAASPIQRIYLGAGGSQFDEIETALSLLHNKQVIVILGFQGYPTPTDTNHIARIAFLYDQLKDRFPNISIGFADHEDPSTPLRHAVAAAAIGAGAAMVEKHITLGRIMKMEDHESALNPDEFHEFVQVIRGCASAIGKVGSVPDFGMSDAEQKYRVMIRRHVVTSRALAKGHTITPEDVILKRAAADDVITDLTRVYQKKINRDIPANTAIGLSDIE